MEAETLCTCSRIATGYMKAAELDKFHDENGTSFQEAASAAGFSAASSQVWIWSLSPCIQRRLCAALLWQCL